MIRKILLFCIIVITALWFAGAHIIKGKIADYTIRYNSDNVKFQFQDIKVSGFPFDYQIKLIAPKISLVNQTGLKEICIDEIILNLGFILNSSKINLGRKIIYNDTISGNPQSYLISSLQDINCDINFYNSLFLGDNDLRDQIKVLQSTIPQVIISTDEREIFNLANIKLLSTNDKQEDNILKVKLSGDYSSPISYMKVNKAFLLVDLDYQQVPSGKLEKIDYEKKLDLSCFQLKFNNAAIDIKGNLKLSRTSLPNGKLDIAIHQYHDVVDTLIPDNFVLPKSFLKKVISKASASELNKNDIGNANFKIVFSDKGISIGKLSLSDLQAD